MCDGVSESEWISVEELLDLVGMRPFERGEEDGNDGMCGLGLGDGDVNGCGRGKESRFHNVMVLCISLNHINILKSCLYPQILSISSNHINILKSIHQYPFVSNKESNPLFDESSHLPCGDE